MMSYALKFRQVCDDFIQEVETKIGRPLSETQKQGIYNCETLMFLEVVIMEFHYAKSDEQIEKWLKHIDGFKRELE